MELGLSEDSQGLEQLKLLMEITIITSDQHSVLSPLLPPSLPAPLVSGQAAERLLGESAFPATATLGHCARRVTSLPACKTIGFSLLLYSHQRPMNWHFV